MPADLKHIGTIGVAIYAVSAIAGYLLPIPHYYESAYKFFFGPIGAFLGYGLGAFMVQRAPNLNLFKLGLVAALAIIAAVILGALYINLFWASPSPSLGERILHAVLYALSFGIFFFGARWAGLLFKQ